MEEVERGLSEMVAPVQGKSLGEVSREISRFSSLLLCSCFVREGLVCFYVL